MNRPAVLFGLLGVLLLLAGVLRMVLLWDQGDVMDINIHDTYIILPPMLLPGALATVCLLMAGTYSFFPRLFGRHLDDLLGFIHFGASVAALASMLLLFIPFPGPRRYYTSEAPMFEGVIDLMTIVAVMMLIGLLGQAVFLFNITRSLLRGQRTGRT